MQECASYLFNDMGKVENPKSRTSRDGGSRALNHGDRAVAASLAIRGLNEKKGSKGRIEIENDYMPLDIANRMRRKASNMTSFAIGRCRW